LYDFNALQFNAFVDRLIISWSKPRRVRYLWIVVKDGFAATPFHFLLIITVNVVIIAYGVTSALAYKAAKVLMYNL